MSDKIKLIVGVLIIFLLLGAIIFVYLSPKTFFSSLGVKKNEVKKTSKIVLNTDFKDPEEYTLITINDILEGQVLKAEKAKATPFDENVLPIKYKRTDVAYNQANLSLDEEFLNTLRTDPTKSPFRNLYFYKIKNGNTWFTILGQQVKNSDGTTSFLHFLVHRGEEIYSWGRNNFFVEPFAIAQDQYFNESGQRDFFSPDKDYYMKGGKIDKLINSWLKTGIVPDELQNEILLMSVKW